MRMPTLRLPTSLLMAALLACTAVVLPAMADERSRERVPEFDAYIKLSELTRLMLAGSLTSSRPAGTTEGELDANLDLTLAPILRTGLREADWARVRYLWARLGYAALSSPDNRGDGPSEHRFIFELTGRVELPHEVWLVNRARVDLREAGGEYSRRYRLRVGVEREFNAGGVVLVPYAQFEASYDTRVESWNRRLYQAGVELELTKQWRIEPYVARQNDSRSASGNLDRVGFALKYYH
jgi:hypothetical protein